MKPQLTKCKDCNCGRERGTVLVNCQCACHSLSTLESDWENSFIERFGYLRQGGDPITGEVIIAIRALLLAHRNSLIREIDNEIADIKKIPVDKEPFARGQISGLQIVKSLLSRLDK